MGYTNREIAKSLGLTDEVVRTRLFRGRKLLWKELSTAMSERTNISFDAALMMALRADAQRELDSLPTPEQFEELYPDTSQWDERMAEALRKKKHRPMLKRVLVAALTLVVLTVGALAVSADFRRAVYTMIQKFLPIEMQLTYQVDGEPLERLPDGYSDHYVPDGFEMDNAQKFERAENFLHVYSSKETEGKLHCPLLNYPAGAAVPV